jgi:hypothetical protein
MNDVSTTIVHVVRTYYERKCEDERQIVKRYNYAMLKSHNEENMMCNPLARYHRLAVRSVAGIFSV